jgi:hypothetical protein
VKAIASRRIDAMTVDDANAAASWWIFTVCRFAFHTIRASAAARKLSVAIRVFGNARLEPSPLAATLARYADFFALFDDFGGYVDFFLLQDLVTTVGAKVRFSMPFDDFNHRPSLGMPEPSASSVG